jgi:hypothetical protein
LQVSYLPSEVGHTLLKPALIPYESEELNDEAGSNANRFPVHRFLLITT